MKKDDDLKAYMQMIKDISATNARDVNKDQTIVNNNLKDNYYK